MADKLVSPDVDDKIKGMAGSSKSKGKAVGKKAAKMVLGKGPKK